MPVSQDRVQDDVAKRVLCFICEHLSKHVLSKLYLTRRILKTIEKGEPSKHMREKASKTIQSKDSLIFLHKCDVCMDENYTIYVPQLDKWYCANCIQIASDLLKKA